MPQSQPAALYASDGVRRTSLRQTSHSTCWDGRPWRRTGAGTALMVPLLRRDRRAQCSRGRPRNQRRGVRGDCSNASIRQRLQRKRDQRARRAPDLVGPCSDQPVARHARAGRELGRGVLRLYVVEMAITRPKWVPSSVNYIVLIYEDEREIRPRSKPSAESRDKRKALDWTQEELAAKSEIDRSYIGSVRSARRTQSHFHYSLQIGGAQLRRGGTHERYS